MLKKIAKPLKAVARRLAWPAKKALDIIGLLVILAIFLWPTWQLLWYWHDSGMVFVPFMKGIGWGMIVPVAVLQAVLLLGYAKVVGSILD